MSPEAPRQSAAGPGAREPSAAPPPAAPEAAATGLVPLAERDAILEKLRQVRFADYFAILGLRAEGPLSDDDVRQAHRRLRVLLDPMRFQTRVSDDFMDHLIEIREGLDDAVEVLADPLVRERYRRALRERREEAS